MTSSDAAGQRNSLRADLRQRRRQIPPAERLRAANGLAEHLFGLPFAPSSGYVSGYWATDGEIALHTWQLNLPSSVVFCLPVLHTADRQLRFAPWRVGDPLRHNRYGIPEPVYSDSSLLLPSAMSFVVMPLVGFSVDGDRLGMGGGWYDRSFEFRLTQDAPPWLVGVGYDVQELPQGQLTAESWDVRPDAICTPSRQLLFSNASKNA